MASVILYTKTGLCPYCDRAKQLLAHKGVHYDEILVNPLAQPELLEEMVQKSGRRTFPQIFIGDYHVGGFDDLWALEQEGKLDPLLAE